MLANGNWFMAWLNTGDSSPSCLLVSSIQLRSRNNDRFSVIEFQWLVWDGDSCWLPGWRLVQILSHRDAGAAGHSLPQCHPLLGQSWIKPSTTPNLHVHLLSLSPVNSEVPVQCFMQRTRASSLPPPKVLHIPPSSSPGYLIVLPKRHLPLGNPSSAITTGPVATEEPSVGTLSSPAPVGAGQH